MKRALGVLALLAALSAGVPAAGVGRHHPHRADRQGALPHRQAGRVERRPRLLEPRVQPFRTGPGHRPGAAVGGAARPGLLRRRHQLSHARLGAVQHQRRPRRPVRRLRRQLRRAPAGDRDRRFAGRDRDRRRPRARGHRERRRRAQPLRRAGGQPQLGRRAGRPAGVRRFLQRGTGRGHPRWGRGASPGLDDDPDPARAGRQRLLRDPAPAAEPDGPPEGAARHPFSR